MPIQQIDHLVRWMLQEQILWDDQGILWLGGVGEATYGRRNFLDLFSVFTSPPLFAVRYGRQELGFVDEMTFLGKQDGRRVLLLGGRAWLVNHIDWQRRVAYVEATEAKGLSWWKGRRPGLGFRLCQSLKHLLAGDGDHQIWSKRARRQIHEVRQEFAWLDTEGTVVISEKNGRAEWWTFAGVGANATLAYELSQTTESHVTHDSFAVVFESHVSLNAIEQALGELRVCDVSEMRAAVDKQAIEGLKFSECLPYEFALNMLQIRLGDPPSIQWVLKQPVRFVWT
jgi:ATP-dependent Lhr-like helicase